jgi:hypothetical protein
LGGVQYKSHVSFSSCRAARSASDGLRARGSSNEVSEPEELNGSYIMPGSELSDEIDRRSCNSLDVAWHAFASLASSLWFRYRLESVGNGCRLRYILEKIVVRGNGNPQPFDASRAGLVILLQSIEGSFARNSAGSVESPFGDKECLLRCW